MTFFKYLKKDKYIREALILIVLLMVFFDVVIGLFANYYYELYYEVEQNGAEFAMLPVVDNTVEIVKDIDLFIEQSESVTDSEYENYCREACSREPAVIKTTYAPNGVVSQVYPNDYSSDIGYDVIGNFTIVEFDAFESSISSGNLFSTYQKQDDILLIHSIVMKNDTFVGIVTIHIDLEQWRESFPETIVMDEIVLYTDQLFLFGSEDMIDDVKHVNSHNYNGIMVYIGNVFHGSYYHSLMRLAYVVVSLISLSLIVVYYFMYRNQKANIEFRQSIDFAYHHELSTNLPNRRSMERDFKDHTEEEKTFYVAYGTFNNVKFINFKYGYELGLDVLKEAINLIRGVVRNTVSMYHLGGDEFAFIFDSNNKNEVQNILNRILRVFERDIVIKRIRTNISMSLGVIDYPRGGKTLDELIKNAHLTLSQSKVLNTNGYVFYSHHEITDIIMNQDFDQYVSKLDLNLFEVYLMPIADVHQDHIMGYECLTRVFNEFDEQLDTLAVVSSLERNGRIQELDQLVFHRMLNYMNEITKEFPDEELFLSVNASALSFNEQFVDAIIDDYKASKISRGRIVLELTESYKVEDHNYLIRLFKRLNKAGIHTAIDDFGSGYSSLSYISKFPIYSIKVDKMYVRDYYKNNFNRTLFLTLRGIAEVLDCKLIAEGVDDPDTLEFLRDNGCDWYQGFYLSKGVPFKQAMAMLRNQQQSKKE